MRAPLFAKAMTSFAVDAQRSVLEEESGVEVLSFRLGGKYSFLVYRRPDGIYATPMTREDGAWKLTLASSQRAG